jgi:apolipoprotein D and lipocalin family protein
MTLWTLALLLAGSLHAAHAEVPLATVEQFDRASYLGRWYQVALIPNRFQAQCLGDTTAVYAALPDGTLQVTNRCRTATGFDEVIGVARPHRSHPGNPAILQVRFAPAWLSFLPFVWGDYWVIATLGHYTAALVGSPDRNFLWVLSRTPQLDEASWHTLAQAAAAQGFDVSKLQRD